MNGQAALNITSFGYLHAPAPAGATVTVDLRTLLRDPHTDPALRENTGSDQAVQTKVMNTGGARDLLAALTDTAHAAAHASAGSPLHIALGCAGGRHRSYVLAARLAAALEARGHTVTLTHRDAHKPVVHR